MIQLNEQFATIDYTLQSILYIHKRKKYHLPSFQQDKDKSKVKFFGGEMMTQPTTLVESDLSQKYKWRSKTAELSVSIAIYTHTHSHTLRCSREKLFPEQT